MAKATDMTMKTNPLVWMLVTFFGALISLPSMAAQDQLSIIGGLEHKWKDRPISEIEAAAKAGDATAQYSMALLLDTGGELFHPSTGPKVKIDPKKSLFWYRKAVDQGNAFAQNNLGVKIYHGRDVALDKNDAIKLLKDSAEQGESCAQRNLATIAMQIEIGGVAQPNYQDAAKWFQRAAEGGDWYSQYDIGRAYEEGLGVVRDRMEALKWYYLSASHGHERAKLAADRLETILTRSQVEEAGLLAKSFTAPKRGEHEPGKV